MPTGNEDKSLITLLIVLIPSLLAAGATYIVAQRKTSGKIASSEAADLWQESQAMRKELRDEVKELRVIITDLRIHIDQLEQEKLVDKEKIAELTTKIRTLERRVKRLESKI